MRCNNTKIFKRKYIKALTFIHKRTDKKSKLKAERSIVFRTIQRKGNTCLINLLLILNNLTFINFRKNQSELLLLLFYQILRMYIYILTYKTLDKNASIILSS